MTDDRKNVKWDTGRWREEQRGGGEDQKVSNSGANIHKNDDKKRQSSYVCSTATEISPETIHNVTLNTVESSSLHVYPMDSGNCGNLNKKHKPNFLDDSRKNISNMKGDFSKSRLSNESDVDAPKSITTVSKREVETEVCPNSLNSSRKGGIKALSDAKNAEDKDESARKKQASCSDITLKEIEDDCCKSSPSSMDKSIRRSARRCDASGKDGQHIFGQVGFIFSKEFPGCCMMRGMVVEVLPGMFLYRIFYCIFLKNAVFDTLALFYC